MSDLVMTPVSGKRGINDFLEVPFALYKDDPNWVAPLYLERYDHLNPKKNPYFKHAEAQLFVASRGGKPVGRISAQLCQLHQARYQDKAGQFGFFECEDNDETARALFNAAAGWLKGKGMDKMRGPYNFSINDEMGLLVDGYDTPPNMFMGHGLPRYPAMVERLGFAKAKDVIAYYTNHTGDYPPVLKRISQRALKSGEVKLRPLERKHLKRDIRIIMDIFNDAWSENWGFVPFTEDELEKLGNDMKLLVTDDYVVIAELNGEPVARLARLSRPLVVATASAYHLRRLRRTLPDWQAVWLPNGSPGLPLESRWRPPETPNPRIIGHTLFNKGGDIAFAASALAARTRPGLTVDWARPDAGRIPPAFVPDGLPIRAHQLVDPYGFVAGASVVLAPLRLSCGTNVYPNVLIEAMASGVPLLTSDLRTHRELVGHEAADALVPDFRPETWARRS